MGKEKITAIILAAGQGKRMNSKVAKQYLLIKEKPVLYYSLKAFEDSIVDDMILVVGEGEETYVKEAILNPYSFGKVKRIVQGGKERYHSVYNALKEVSDAEYVLIHDGARPFVTEDIITRIIQSVKVTKASIAGMPVKDTIKIADKNQMVKETPNREDVWMIQTPQAFEYHLIREAYEKIIKEENAAITDDAMVLESTTGHKVQLIEGSYQNIKITTREDIYIAESFLACNSL